MKKYIGMVVFLLLYTANANAVDVGVGVKAGINGLGLNLGVGVTESINVRVSGSRVDLDDEDETLTVGDDSGEGDIEAELELDFGSNALLVDWHVFNGGFRFTAGMFKQTGEVDLSGTLQDDIIIDGQPLAANDLGEISGEVKLSDSYQPYIGIGWGRVAGGQPGFSFTADIGVAMLDPEVEMKAQVLAGDNNLTQQELDNRLADLEKDAEDELDDYELWPVLSVGVNYTF